MNLTNEKAVTPSVEEFVKGLAQAREHSLVTLEKAKKAMERPTCVAPDYEAGDRIWISIWKEERRPFGPIWRGPYPIIVKKGKRAYQVDEKGTKHHVYHEGRLKLYILPETPGEERELPIVHREEP